MNDELVIRSQTDTSTRDNALAQLRTLMTESAQIIIDGIVLRRGHAELVLKSHTDVESGHILDYPVTWEDLRSALQVDDEDAVVRSEACAAILEWMREADVPSSPGFEEFFRWAIFEDLLIDGDHLTVLDAAGAPVPLPVGWQFEPDEEDGDRYEVRIESRPHLAPLRDRTWMVIRADGWSALLFDGLGWIGYERDQVAPPNFVTVRPGEGEATVWFRNEDVIGDDLAEHRDVLPSLSTLKREVANWCILPSTVEGLWSRAFPPSVGDRARNTSDWRILGATGSRIAALRRNGDTREAETLRAAAVSFFNKYLPGGEVGDVLRQKAREELRKA